jgi:hypothetical protein
LFIIYYNVYMKRNYFEYISSKFELLLKHSLFGLAKGERVHSYCLVDLDHCSQSVKEQNLDTIEEFLKDFKSYMEGKSPLQFIYKDNVNLYYHFSREIFNKLFYDNAFDSSTNPSEGPTVDQLLKIGQLFKEGTIRADSVFNDMPRGLDKNGRDYKDFLLFLMTIPNDHLFENNQISVNTINHEISNFANAFKASSEPKVKDTFKIYLENRKEIIKNINSPSLEKNLFERIKKAVAPKYWSELVFAFPSLVEPKGIVTANLVDFDDEKIYHLNLNKGAIYKLCPSLINNQDLMFAFRLIHDSIMDNKPQEISMIHHYEMKSDIKVIFSGKDIDDSYLGKIGELYRKMLDQYNNDEVIKLISEDNSKHVYSCNKEYLDNSAKMLWLDVMLDPSVVNNKKKLKM